MDLEEICRRTHEDMAKTVKINLGSGKDYRKGYINVDNQKMFSGEKLDVESDIKDYSVEDNTVDEILLSHVVMYLRPEELRPLLKRWHSWLKSSGALIIETSDFKKLSIIVCTENLPEIINDYGLINMFGREGEPSHRWGWTRDALIAELQKAGFSRFGTHKGFKKVDRDFTITALK